MTFSLSMHCDNAAFDANPNDEIARILRTVVARLEDRSCPMRGFLRDANGNNVGTFEVTP